MNKKGLAPIAIIIIIVLILIGAGAWYWYSRPKAVKTTEEAIKALTAPAVQVPTNPVQGKVPELNPVDRANPFTNSYKNPFE